MESMDLPSKNISSGVTDYYTDASYGVNEREKNELFTDVSYSTN